MIVIFSQKEKENKECKWRLKKKNQLVTDLKSIYMTCVETQEDIYIKSVYSQYVQITQRYSYLYSKIVT